MTADNRNFAPPHEVAGQLGQVVDPGGGFVPGLAPAPVPGALATATPGLAAGALAPPIRPSGADEPNQLVVAIERLAGELFGGSFGGLAAPVSLAPMTALTASNVQLPASPGLGTAAVPASPSALESSAGDPGALARAIERLASELLGGRAATSVAAAPASPTASHAQPPGAAAAASSPASHAQPPGSLAPGAPGLASASAVSSPFAGLPQLGDLSSLFGGAPSNFGGAPSGFGGAPSGFGGAPSGFGGSPSGFGGAPSGFGGSPSGFGGAPSDFGGSPSGFGGSPSGFGGAPSVFGGCPSGFGGAPSGFAGSPSGFGGNPSRFGDAPSGFGGNGFDAPASTFAGQPSGASSSAGSSRPGEAPGSPFASPRGSLSSAPIGSSAAGGPAHQASQPPRAPSRIDTGGEAQRGRIRDLGGTAFDPYTVRRDFPILEERVHGGKRLVWLDNAATTQKPSAVIDRLSHFYEHENSNIHRAAHALAARATDAYESARESTRRFVNAPSTSEIIFVRGATEGINLVAQSWGRRNVAAGDEIVVTHLEHHANIVPWQQLCAAVGARLRVAPVDDRGDVILEAYERLLGPRTRLVAFPQVSNALGTVTPAREMIEIAHRRGALVLLDGAQAVSHTRVDVQQLDCDFYVLSGHKVFAPTGIGAVFGKRAVLEAMPPWQGGGNMIQDVTFENTTYQQPPWRFEAGTGSIGDAVGLGAALDYVTRIGIDNIDRYEHELLRYAEDQLASVAGLQMVGAPRHKAGVLSFVLDGQRTEDVGSALDKDGIAVRSGHHCAQPILRRFGHEASVRASLAFYNICEDIDALVDALRRLQAGRG